MCSISWILLARAVCREWQSVFSLENYSPSSQDCAPWLMLAEREDSDIRGLFNPSTSEVYDIPLPELWQKKIVGSAHGWVVTIGEDLEIHLYNPLTRVQIKLPPQTNFGYDTSSWSPSDVRDYFLKKVVLFSSPSKGDCMALAVYNDYDVAAIARPGDEVWTTLGGTKDWRLFQDYIHYMGNIYAIDIHGGFGMFDFSSEPKTIKLGSLPPLPINVDDKWNYWDRHKKYLVELSGDLLVIVRRVYNVFDSDILIDDDEDFTVPEVVIRYKTVYFKIYKLYQLQPEVEWVELKDLGDYSLFVGKNTSFSVKASQAGAWWRRNCIYFTDDCFEYFGIRKPNEIQAHDQGVYNLEDQSFQLHYQGTSSSHYSPPIWFTPGL
ncbi:F-box protein At2g26160-like [Aristolochia californica]|uniref:F-box protein At2g26160-like n=1 Tax=Aristolochia californica TaxID=171875 RepID=UPI0035D85C2E